MVTFLWIIGIVEHKDNSAEVKTEQRNEKNASDTYYRKHSLFINERGPDFPYLTLLP